MDTFAPLTERKIRSSNRKKWYNDGIYKYRKSKDQHDLLLLQQRDELKSAMCSAKCEYVSDTINAVKHDQKALYQQFNVLLHRTKENLMPDYLQPNEVSNSLNEFLSQKLKIFDPLLLTLMSATSTMAVTLIPVFQHLMNLVKIKSSHSRNLGVLIDEHLSLIPQIHSVVKSCRYHLRSMWKIKRFLSADTAKALAHSMILSRIDYCNSLYLIMPAYAIELLQKLQNEAARFGTRTPRRESITPALVALHWIPVKQRISFKVLTILCSALHDSGPQYIQDKIQTYESTHHLRSTSQIRLKDNRFRLKSDEHRAFSIAAPHM